MSAPSLPELVSAHWSPDWTLDAQLALCAALYLQAAWRVRGPWPLARTFSFLAGLCSVLVALQSGLDTFDDRLLSVHMVQHMVLLQLAPLLLLGGRPVTLTLRALPRQPRVALARMLVRLGPLTSPALCITIFSAVLLVSHLPSFYGSTLRSPGLHGAEHVAYIFAGALLWWPLLDGDPVAGHRLTGLGKLLYMLAAMPAMALIGAYLNRHVSLVYPSYAAPARVLGVSATADQQQAGAIMWVAGSMMVVAVGLWAVLAALVAEERRQQTREAREARIATGAIADTAPDGGRIV